MQTEQQDLLTTRLEQEVERLENVVRRRRVKLADVKSEAQRIKQHRENHLARAERSLESARKRLTAAAA